MAEGVLFSEVVAYSAGGGWGSEAESDTLGPASVIRGADFPGVALGSLEGAPLRFEKPQKIEKCRLQPDDIVLEISGGTADRPTGRTVFVSERLLAQRPVPVIPASFCRLVRIDRDVADPRYCYYWLQAMHSSGRAFAYQNRSTGLSNFQFKHFLQTERVRLPSMAEQTAIGAALGSLDDKIEVNRRISETLEEIARALFKSWFVDFDPVRGTATVPEDVRRLFPDRLVDSPIGPIPEGWEVATVANVATVNARTAKTADLPETICYADISSASTDGVVTPVELSCTSAPSRARRLLAHGDTVLSTVRPERRSHFLCINPPPNMIASTGFATLTPSRVPWSYLYAAICRPAVFETLGHLASGGAYPAIRPAIVAGLPVVLPSTDLLARFHEIAAPMFEKRATLLTESKTLAELRDTLLPKLISGGVRLS